ATRITPTTGVFRLVSLRCPDKQKTVDPTGDEVVVARVLRSVHCSAIDWRNRSEERREDIKLALHVGRHRSRNAIPWLNFVKNFAQESTADFSRVALQPSDGKSVSRITPAPRSSGKRTRVSRIL